MIQEGTVLILVQVIQAKTKDMREIVYESGKGKMD